MQRKCGYCGEPKANGYAAAAHLLKKSNAIYFCKDEKCRKVISTLCACVNIMNRRLKEGAIYPAQKNLKSECQRMFLRYQEHWEERLDREAFPDPKYFQEMGIESI